MSGSGKRDSGNAVTAPRADSPLSLLAWLDNTDEALAGVLRPGNAGSDTAADHIQVTDEALAQIPDADRRKGAGQRRRDRCGVACRVPAAGRCGGPCGGGSPEWL